MNVVIARYTGMKGIYDGTCLFTEIITKVERIQGNNFLLLNITGATTRTRNPNRNNMGGNSGEFHVDSTTRRIR